MEPRTRSTSTSMAGVEWMSPQEGLEVLQRHPVPAVGDSVTRQLVHSAWSYVSMAVEKDAPGGDATIQTAFDRFVAGWSDVPKHLQHVAWQNYSIGNRVLMRRGWASTRGAQLSLLKQVVQSTAPGLLFDTIYLGKPPRPWNSAVHVLDGQWMVMSRPRCYQWFPQ